MHAQEWVVDMMWRIALARLLDWSIPVNFFLDFRLLSAFDSFWWVINKMATFVAKNSGAVKKKSVIILKEYFFFVLVSTSSASNWQGCEDSHWIKRTTFVFHKIAIYNSWTWKQSEDSFKISLTPGVQKLFLLWREIGDKIDHYISYRVFFCVKQQKVPATDEITG